MNKHFIHFSFDRAVERYCVCLDKEHVFCSLTEWHPFVEAFRLYYILNNKEFSVTNKSFTVNITSKQFEILNMLRKVRLTNNYVRTVLGNYVNRKYTSKEFWYKLEKIVQLVTVLHKLSDENE